MKNLQLIDDGTLDTVFFCDACGGRERFSDVERDSDGYVTEEEISRLTAEHAEECDGPENLSYHNLACRWYAGQWSSLYAFLSTGTIQETLSSEILSCIPHAEKNSHPNELQALKEFQAWAEQEEAKKFPSLD